MASNPLFIYNTSIPQSLIDAQTCIADRMLPTNLLGVNFGATDPGTLTNASLLACSIQANTFYYHGAKINTYDGNNAHPNPNIGGGMAPVAAAYPFDSLVFSTYTPMAIFDSAGGNYQPVVGFYASWFWANSPLSQALLNTMQILPNGRLGCASTGGGLLNWNFATELVTKSGANCWASAHSAALLAEKRFNRQFPHFSSAGQNGQYFVTGPTSPGFTATWYQNLMGSLRSRNVNITVDLGKDIPFTGTGSAGDFQYSSLASASQLFALVGGFSYNGGIVSGDTNAPGSLPYSNNYTLPYGGWMAIWYSFQFYLAADFLWNGGCAALTTIAEPLSSGIRNPAVFVPSLMDSQVALLDCLSAVYCGTKSDGAGDAILNYGKQTVIGDPFFRPYAQSKQSSAAWSVPGMV